MVNGIRNPYETPQPVEVVIAATENDSVTLDCGECQVTLHYAFMEDIPARLGKVFLDLMQKHRSILLRNGIGFFTPEQTHPPGDMQNSKLVTPSGTLYVFVVTGDTETEILKRLGHTLVQANDRDLLLQHRITLKVI